MVWAYVALAAATHHALFVHRHLWHQTPACTHTHKSTVGARQQSAAIYTRMQLFHKVYDECVMDDVVAQPNDVGQSQSSSSQAGNLEQLAE